MPVLLPEKFHGQRVAWWAIVHGVVRVRHNLVTEQQKSVFIYIRYKSLIRYNNNNEKFEILQVTKL